MENTKRDKTTRLLDLYTRLMNGYIINKTAEAIRYGVNDRSIQRDIEDIRSFLDDNSIENGVVRSVVYDRSQNGYRLEQIYKMRLSNSEILAICKILLESRAFTKEEMSSLIDRLIECCTPQANQRLVEDLIRNEEFHYVEPRHKTDFLEILWQIGQAVKNCQYIEIQYERLKDHKIVERKVEPVAIMFSEYYFYLTAFIDKEDMSRKDFDILNDSFPTIYRIDRIKNLKILDEKFYIPYSSRFEEGEFRKRIQFMYGGKLQTVRFKYTGPDIDAILDRLPTAQILDHDEDGYIIRAEVFGKGIDMWLRSQGDYVSVLNKK